MLITHATLANPARSSEFRQDAGLLIRDGVIAQIGATAAIAAQAQGGEETVDAGGGLVLPGLVCAHTHFYGAFARGMSLPGAPAENFPQILERLWWRLDKLLQPEDSEYSALVFMCDAIRHGTTTVIDHHASPSAIDGSLDVMANACAQAGVRACLSYELSDRDGPDSFARGLRENERFGRRAGAGRPSTSGMLAACVGLHASFTLSDDSLSAAGALARALGVGCHLHVAEDNSDSRDSLHRAGIPVVARLERAGVLGPKTIAAHCVHVSDPEIPILLRSGATVVHNPRSNMNNAVGTAPVATLLAAGVPVGLGNDGFSMNMFQELKTAYLLHKHASGDPRAMPGDTAANMLWGQNAALAADLFSRPGLGRLEEGAPADLVVLDYRPPTPVTAGNLPWHVAFGIDGEHVATTIVDGRVLMRNRELLTLDEERIHARSRELAKALWQRV